MRAVFKYGLIKILISAGVVPPYQIVVSAPYNGDCDLLEVLQNTLYKALLEAFLYIKALPSNDGFLYTIEVNICDEKPVPYATGTSRNTTNFDTNDVLPEIEKLGNLTIIEAMGDLMLGSASEEN